MVTDGTALAPIGASASAHAVDSPGGKWTVGHLRGNVQRISGDARRDAGQMRLPIG